MTSFSFKTFLKVANKDELKALAENSSHINDLCSKLNLKYSQVKYLYRKIGIDLHFSKKEKNLVANPSLDIPKETLVSMAGKPLQRVSLDLKLKPKKVKELFAKHGLPIPVKANNFATSCPISKEDLEYQYLTLNQSLSALGEKYDVSKQLVANWCVFYNIPVRNAGFFSPVHSNSNIYKHPIWNLTNEEFLLQVKQYSCISEFCKSQDISANLFYRFLDERKIPSPFPRNKLTTLTKEYLLDLYLNKDMTLKQIAEHENCHLQTINRYFKAFGINAGLKRKLQKI